MATSGPNGKPTACYPVRMIRRLVDMLEYQHPEPVGTRLANGGNEMYRIDLLELGPAPAQKGPPSRLKAGVLSRLAYQKGNRPML